MAEPTSIDCIDNIVESIESSAGIQLIREVEKSKQDNSEQFKLYVYESFKYKNGRGKEAHIAFNYEVDMNTLDGGGGNEDYCELYLLDVPTDSDARVKKYFEEHPKRGLDLMPVGYADKPNDVLRKGITITHIQDGLCETELKFLSYVMTSQAK